jgi:hypothetical protein
MSRNGKQPLRVVFVVIDREEGGLDLLGPWDELEEAREAVDDQELHYADRWFILRPIEVGEVTRV